MIQVIGNWGYILLTSWIAGCAVLYPIYRSSGYQYRSGAGILFAGLTAVTVYAQIFSLFYKVGLAANVVLLVFCAAVVIVMGKKIHAMTEPITGGIGWKELLVIVLVFLFWAYGTSVGGIHYDSNLYHAQSIRWIEEYGVVPGMGNLQSRLAYNSASFALSALYSMAFLSGQSLHTAAGFFAFLCALTSLGFFRVFRRKKLLVSDFARIGMFYYITVIYKEMNSPASDYFTMLVIFFLLVKWLELWETGEECVTPYALLSVLGVFAVSLKLSAGAILLLAVKPAAMLIKEKRVREIFLYLGLGLLVILPFLARNVMISGWLVYPFTALDLFRVDWKMPVFTANYDAREIQVWARGIYDVAKYGMPFREWAGNWFMTELSGTEKLLVAGSLASVPVGFGTAAVAVWKKRKELYGLFLVQLTVLVCFCFWLFSAPMMRYGYVYPVMLPLLAAAPLLLRIFRDRQKLLYLFLTAFLMVRSVQMGREAAGMFVRFGIHVRQVDYGTFEAEEEKVGNITVFVPTQGDQAGYDLFPSAPAIGRVKPRGEDIRDGFSYDWE